MTNPAYDAYIRSTTWKAKRKEVLKRDNYRCQTCWETGTEYNLHCHHKHYENFGQEKSEDLITLCADCHQAITNTIRQRRYQNKAIPNTFINNNNPQNRKELNNVEASTIQPDFSLTNAHAQRRFSQPKKPIR